MEAANLVMELIKDETGYTMYRQSDYMDQQASHFSAYLDHPIFDMTRKMYENGFSYDAISGNLHSVDKNGDLLEGLLIDENRVKRAGGAGQLKLFVETLNDFRVYSDYDNYFQENKDFYIRELELAKKHITSVELSEELINFYGYALENINVCIIPDSMGGFGISNTYQDRVEAIPTLPVYDSENGFISFLVHELSHPYINPQTNLYPEYVTSSTHLFEPIKRDMEKQAYTKWDNSLNEHIVRACTYLIMEQLYSGEYNSKILDYELDRKFVYIESIINSLEEYRVTRNKYPNINAYYEELLTSISELDVYND
jgi:hypothetical protein